MKEKLEQIKQSAVKALSEIKAEKDLEAIRVKYLGKKGDLTAILKQMGSLSPEERPVMGQLANKVRSDIEAKIAEMSDNLKKQSLERRLKAETVDVTMPGIRAEKGGLHPLNIVLDDMIDIFRSMGFDVVDGPEVETDFYNFKALNVPDDHPARDMQDTFYLGDNLLLRTQTSAAHSHNLPRQSLPCRRGRRDPLSRVPPN